MEIPGTLVSKSEKKLQKTKNLSSIDYRICRRPKSLKRLPEWRFDAEYEIEHRKASIRCKVEHVFRIIKRQFGYQKTAYRGLAKNTNRLYALVISSNLYMMAMAGRRLRKA